jgi:hypothetical protein
VATFRARDGLGLTSADVAEIAVAATDGRVDQLLLPRAAPGAQPTDVDGGAALDEVIAAVLGARGRVVVAPASALDTVAAIYRW